MSDLTDFLRDQGMSQRAFAEMVGVDRSIVSRLARREMRPSLELAFEIERATAGRVPAESWLAPDDGAAS